MTWKLFTTRLETELSRMIAKKVSGSIFAKLIIKHLALTANHYDLETLYNEIGEIQRLTKATGNTGQSAKGSGKETSLANPEGGGGAFKGKYRNCNKVGHKRAQCTKAKKSGGGGNGGNGRKCCNHCGLKGHL